MKKIYVLLFTENKIFLIQDDHGRLSLPCHKHWPVVKAVPQKKWNESLIRHLTFGLLSMPSVRQERPFGLDKDAAFYMAEVQGLEKILEQCNSVKRWNAYFAKYTCPWTLKLIDSTEIPNTIDANSAACIQASKKDQKDSI